MDRFVTRTPSWKTLNYNTVVAKSASKRPESTKPTPAQALGVQKKPMQQKQLSDATSIQDLSRRLSEIFHPVPPSSVETAGIENFNGNSNDSGLSSASSISPPIAASDNERPCSESICKTPTKNNLGKLGDYVDCPEEKENDTCMTIIRTPKSSKKGFESQELKENKTPSKQLPQTAKSNKLQHMSMVPTILTAAQQITPTKNPILMSRIQRDLNSPSASVRVRALKALASPAKSPYTHFDIPEAEQSLSFSTSEDNRDIKDVMRNVAVYVEVRSGEDNRSEGVRKVIEALGARVNLTMNKETTHVVFKEGRLSTFKKAQQLGIPVVSILWVEACKTQNRICDPKDFPISNLDRYENPVLYPKMKVFRHMQPGSECTRRKVKTPTSSKTATPTQKTATFIRNSTLIGTTPTRSFSNTKTDITHFFKKLEKANKVLTTPKSTTTIANIPKAMGAPPASQILDPITSLCNSSLQQVENASMNPKLNDTASKCIVSSNGNGSDESNCDLNKTNKVKKVLDFVDSKTAEGSDSVIEETPKSKSQRGRVITTPGIKAPAGSTELPNTPKVQKRRSTLPSKDIETMAASETPIRETRRRSSIHTPKSMTLDTLKPDRAFEAISEEIFLKDKIVEKIDAMAEKGDIPSDLAIGAALNSDLNKPFEYSKSGRRRTVYSYKTMNESGKNAALAAFNIAKRRPTNYSVKSIKTETFNISNKNDMDSTKEKESKANISEKSEYLTEGKLSKPNNSKATPVVIDSSIRRRTLYTPKKGNANKVSRVAAPTVPTDTDGLHLTPTASDMQGKVAACSTLLESAGKSSENFGTPPTVLKTGKLMEETKDCNTPYLFSSTRQPGNKRRTLFDVSMDIITQRVQCINQSARRSLNPSATDNISNNTNQKPLDTSPLRGFGSKRDNVIIIPDTDSENSTSVNLLKNVGETTPSCDASATHKKKRKLFIPNEAFTPPPIGGSAAINKLNTSSARNRRASLNSSLASSVTKRRTSLMPLAQATFSVSNSILSQVDSAEDTSSLSSPLRKRRSTLYFEQSQNNVGDNAEKAMDDDWKPSEQEKQDHIDVESKRMPVIVYTNMHKEQIDVIREAVEKLGNCCLEQTVSDRTTHLVSLEPRRTMNLLRALVRGLWIVEYSWILDSIKAGKLLPEEPYELQGFSRAIEICRSERQAFGCNYKCELFRDLGSFYASLRCYPIRRDDLIALITLCGGRLSPSRNKARYIIGDPNALMDEKIYITPYWILDSISQMQIMKIQKYLYPKPLERPEPTSPTQSIQNKKQ